MNQQRIELVSAWKMSLVCTGILRLFLFQTICLQQMFGVFDDRWNAAKLGWKSLVSPPPRKDFALFIRLEIIGSSKGFVEEDQKKAQGNLSFIFFIFLVSCIKTHKRLKGTKK